MAWTQSDVDKLKKAMATGVKRVEFDGHATMFQDTGEMISLLKRMEAEVAAAAVSAGTSRTILVSHGRGV